MLNFVLSKQVFFFKYSFFDYGYTTSSHNYFYLFFFVSFILIFFLFCVSLFFSNFFFSDLFFLKFTSFECGFDPIWHNQELNLSFHYFKVALLFIIFDLEILYLFPWIVCAKFFFLNGFFFFFIPFFIIFLFLFIGIFIEYFSNLLDWYL